MFMPKMKQANWCKNFRTAPGEFYVSDKCCLLLLLVLTLKNIYLRKRTILITHPSLIEATVQNPNCLSCILSLVIKPYRRIHKSDQGAVERPGLPELGQLRDGKGRSGPCDSNSYTICLLVFVLCPLFSGAGCLNGQH
jgi:hypothetical protein